MGTYVYTLSPPSRSRKIELIDGAQDKFLTLDFFCRSGDEDPNFRYGEERRSRQCLQNALERKRETWRGVVDKIYVAVINDKPEAGDRVYLWNGEIDPVWYDCDKMPGHQVGYLHKEGRRWFLVSDTNPLVALANEAL